jgi:hypothetical protein
MYAIFITDLISVIVLTGSIYLLWKERKRLYSLSPFLPAIVFLLISHSFDMLMEHPSIRLSDYFHVPVDSLEVILATSGNIAETLSFTLLIYGFVKVIRHEQSEEKRIRELEHLLPLCSNCKKYRTGEGRWLPIEQYLLISGAPRVTHGICPECFEKLYGKPKD